MNATVSKRNRDTLRKLSVIAVLMFGFGYALVPLYKKICEVTGVNDVARPDTVVNTQVDTSRTIVMEFDANVRGDLPWQLMPRERKRTIHPGELVHVVFDLTNASDVSFKAQAIPSYGPQRAGLYVKKLECFCFSQQEIQPREQREMPVVLVIEPTIPKDVHTVTLSYTMFQIEGTQGETTAMRAGGGKG